MNTHKLSAFLWSSIVVLVVSTCVGLGFWQLDRAEQKQAREQLLQQWASKGCIPFTQAQRLINSDVDATGMQTAVSGRVLQHYWLLDNQVYQGRVGYDVLVLVMPQGASRWLLINLGFIVAPTTREQLPQLQLPTQITLDDVLIKEGPLGSITLAQSSPSMGWPKRVQQIDITQIANQARVPVYNFMAYAQTPSPLVATEPHYQPVTMPAEKHIAYAWQWFLIALAALLIALTAFWRARRGYDKS
ncbi:SURF1 family protein [Pseudoalteromonas sp. THAF3]|uniref:SURF1 family protein n=1 Tax=Pseudoalteromonas sp. THAF3 TaxID=2587843 RepID=UPI0015624337|nr:SURF1 family protein [Pseudoalteromonas sp. THAF3]